MFFVVIQLGAILAVIVMFGEKMFPFQFKDTTQPIFGLSAIKILKFGFSFAGTELLTLGIGMAVAFAASVLAIKFLMGYIIKHDFKAFGWYRIALGILVILITIIL